MDYYVYPLTSRPHGTLYVGVTNDMERRLAEHRAGVASRFTWRYSVQRLVFVECTSSPRDAIARCDRAGETDQTLDTREESHVDRSQQSSVG